MSNHTKLTIIASGAVTPLGLSAASTCAAIRACLNNFRETHFVDGQGAPLLGATVPAHALLGSDEDAVQGGPDKLAAMFVRAVRECLQQVQGFNAAQTALLLVGPESSRPGITAESLREVFDACQATLGEHFHDASRITQIGTPGLAVALKYSRELLADPNQSGVHAVLIVGLDSLLNTSDILAGLQQRRLLAQNNSDGFIPGEACASLFIIGERSNITAPSGNLVVRGLGIAQETETLLEQKPSRGQGLAAAIRQALDEAGLGAHDMHTRLSDATAESYFFEEASFAWTRLLRQRSPEGYGFFTLMNRVGHIGAAMGPLTLVVTLDQVRKQWATGPHTLVHLSSAHTPRAAVVVTAA
ncbi:hypothetical protein QWZ03_13205 [Chitinimonas viridis]|uniref:3-oxoacyl-ACP synthase n=2 Tax=Chitinimonas TaxID=240411 RepID=A0ABT8B7K6_9NEIS|nr:MULTISPECIES: hypothetical protein [Chitinimonas]MDN3577730.1 hypothetical protein [Chitinimonas viridis]GLR15280.1 3-oxoacyl-ACP synthase [Chitinimonas prasina]